MFFGTCQNLYLHQAPASCMHLLGKAHCGREGTGSMPTLWRPVHCWACGGKLQHQHLGCQTQRGKGQNPAHTRPCGPLGFMPTSGCCKIVQGLAWRPAQSAGFVLVGATVRRVV